MTENGKRGENLSSFICFLSSVIGSLFSVLDGKGVYVVVRHGIVRVKR